MARGHAPGALFDGRGACFLDLGDGTGTMVQGEFYATPEPRVTLEPPAKRWLQEKEKFERERLVAWFGA